MNLKQKSPKIASGAPINGDVIAQTLRALYNKHKDGGPKKRLTMDMIRQEVGVSTISTVSGWISEGEYYHEPKGASLRGLVAFLEKCKDSKYLKAVMAKGK